MPGEEEEYPGDIEAAEGLKIEGNEFFKNGEYQKAVDKYEEALGECPEEEIKLRSICFANLSTCLYRLEKYEESVERAGKALELDETYSKARLRRAMANEKIDTWASLETALEDLTKLKEQQDKDGENKDSNLLKDVKSRIVKLEPKIKSKQQEETQEMVGKLKDLGNGFLNNFGMSLDNFQMTQNADGGYSVNMR